MVRDGIAQYWTARTDGTWCLVVVAVVDWFYLIVINVDVKPSQSAGTGDRARGTGHGVLRVVVAVFSMNCLRGLTASF